VTVRVAVNVAVEVFVDVAFAVLVGVKIGVLVCATLGVSVGAAVSVGIISWLEIGVIETMGVASVLFVSRIILPIAFIVVRRSDFSIFVFTSKTSPDSSNIRLLFRT